MMGRGNQNEGAITKQCAGNGGLPPARRRIGWRRLWLMLATLPIVGLAGRSVFFQGPFLPPRPLPDSPLLDVHCHVAGIGAGNSGCFISSGMRNSYKFGVYLRGFGISQEELMQKGDALLVRRISEQIAASRHVGQAILLAMDGVLDSAGQLDRFRTEIYVPDKFVAEETAKYENLWFGASINPYRRDALERLEWAHTRGARLVKWLPSIQLFDPSDEHLISFYRKLAQLHLPLLTHAGKEMSFTQARDEFADPEKLRLPLSLGVTVLVAHVASTGSHEGLRDIDRLAAMMPQHANLLSDISSLTQLNKPGYFREALLRPEFRGRLVYGTDFPLINTLLVSPWHFPLNLEIGQMWKISRIENPWDRDVALKQALGTPPEIFARGRELFDH